MSEANSLEKAKKVAARNAVNLYVKVINADSFFTEAHFYSLLINHFVLYFRRITMLLALVAVLQLFMPLKG
jgi:hypothetical protein